MTQTPVSHFIRGAGAKSHSQSGKIYVQRGIDRKNFKGEANLKHNLVLYLLPGADRTAGLNDLEPLYIAQGLTSPSERILDRLFYATARRPDDLGDFVNRVFHILILVPGEVDFSAAECWKVRLAGVSNKPKIEREPNERPLFGQDSASK
jgi:hypothetical protein